MKHIKSKFIIGATFVCLPYVVNAMTPANENSDSLENAKVETVQVA